MTFQTFTSYLSVSRVDLLNRSSHLCHFDFNNMSRRSRSQARQHVPLSLRTRSPLPNRNATSCSDTDTVNDIQCTNANPKNWTAAKLRAVLSDMGIKVPTTVKRTVLLQLYHENLSPGNPATFNHQPRVRHLPAVSVNLPDINNPADLDTLTASVLRKRPSAAEESTSGLCVNNNEDHHQRADITTEIPRGSENVSSSNDIRVLSSQVAQLAANVKTIMSRGSFQSAPVNLDSSVPFENQVPSQSSTNINNLLRDELLATSGVPSESVPYVDVVPNSIRKNILAGKDINLSYLLIPDSDLSINTNSSNIFGGVVSRNSDPRLHTSLSLGEFITAFGKYRNIMCDVYPQRRKELDDYERNIVDIATRYSGSLFYEYHKAFSARAAALLEQKGIKVDWGIRDNNLYCSILAGHRGSTCSYCSSTDHLSNFCPVSSSKGPSTNNQGFNNNNQSFRRRNTSATSTGKPTRNTTDVRGRLRVFHRSQEICNNFNTDAGCKHSGCSHLHVCLSCKKDHPQTQCGK